MMSAMSRAVSSMVVVVARLGQVAVPPVLVSEPVGGLAVDHLGRGQVPQSKTSFGDL